MDGKGCGFGRREYGEPLETELARQYEGNKRRLLHLPLSRSAWEATRESDGSWGRCGGLDNMCCNLQALNVRFSNGIDDTQIFGFVNIQASIL